MISHHHHQWTHANKLVDFEKLHFFPPFCILVYNGVNSRRANWKIFSWELWQIRGVGRESFKLIWNSLKVCFS